MPTLSEIRNAFPRDPWPHQERGLADLLKRLIEVNSVVVASPTGAGKGLMQSALLNLFQQYGKRAIIYNCRRMLTQQTSDRLEADGLSFGTRAASMKGQQDLMNRFQVASIQTDIARVLNQQVWDIHDADYVIVDEAHLVASQKSLELFQRYLSRGAKLIGFTGTPIGINHLYRDIVVAGTNSELRACQAHVPAKVYAVHEMDTSKIRPVKTGEFTEGDIRKECWSQAIVGHIYKDYRRLNPDGKPALVAAPGIGESVWVQEQFRDKGHKVAHIDCREVIVNGERYANDPNGTVREQVLSDMRKGEFDVLCNCEVIQQGVDIPNLAHLILARPYGSLANCIQVYGRVIRYSESTPDQVVVQDHGGNWLRHGSPNEDRDWGRLFSMTEKEIADERERGMEDDTAPEPITCVKCGAVRTSGNRCHECGFMSDKRERVIVQQDGQLQLVEGKQYQKKDRKPEKSKEQKQWDKVFFSSRNSRSNRAMTFKAAAKVYERNYGEPLPSGLKYLPKHREDWGRRIRDVDWKDLR